MTHETATFGMGCFWSPQRLFSEVPGVLETTVGYMGGKTQQPTYEQVCDTKTGHAEVVQIVFDPKIVSYEKLLELFWSNHDPTTKNRQGPDVGSQYRSAIFYHTPAQQKAAEKTKPVEAVTEITKAPTFWPAESYHQHYLKKRGKFTCAY
jgi:peptide-methionine (S)-S-oxide reductase